MIRVKIMETFNCLRFFVIFEIIFDSMKGGNFARLYTVTPERMAIGVAKK